MKIIADENIPFVAECCSSIGEVETVPGREITRSLVLDADALLVRSITRVDSSLLADSKVRFVGTATIGFEHVDVDYLAQKNLGFASAPGSNANSVAEYIVAALLSVGKKHGIELAGKSVGIIGVGNVGRRVEEKAKALGMKVYLNDPPLQRQTGDSKYLPIEALCGCDFVTLHPPLTFEGMDKTFHLADEKFFGSLKPGCVFINTARGGVTDTGALKAAIKSGKPGGVVLDVWENEPNIDVELLRMVDLSTPHIAGYSLDGKIAGMIMIYEAACKHFGLAPSRTIPDFLPEPGLPRLTIDTAANSEHRDDFNTREIAMVAPEKRGEFFDDLRKNYPVRREFQNTEIILGAEEARVAEKLAGIGFRIKKSRCEDTDYEARIKEDRSSDEGAEEARGLEAKIRKEKGKTVKKLTLRSMNDWQTLRQKPIQFALVGAVGLWVLFFCVPVIFATPPVSRVSLLAGGFLYCAILSFMSVGICQCDFAYRYSKWAKTNKKTVIIIGAGLLLLLGLLYLAQKIWPEFMVRAFILIARPMLVISEIVLASMFVASIGGWIKYSRREKKGLKD
jgi:erythronate-4-phosphate dehydrogenase